MSERSECLAASEAAVEDTILNITYITVTLKVIRLPDYCPYTDPGHQPELGCLCFLLPPSVKGADPM